MLLLSACTQETQNKLSRAVQNLTSTDGVLGIYAGETGNQQSVELSLQELIVTNLLSIGDDPKKPLWIIRPERAADGTTITNNQTGFAHETSAIEVDAEYYDL